MKGLWSLVAIIALFPAIFAWLWITGHTRELLEFTPPLAVCTVAGVVGIVALYRESKATITKS